MSKCVKINNVLLSGGAKPPTGILLLYYSITSYKSPEKKWHRSVKMDKNINVHFSKVPGKSCKRPPRKTRCQHNAANRDFYYKMLAAHIFNIYYGQNDLTTIGYPIISFRII